MRGTFTTMLLSLLMACHTGQNRSDGRKTGPQETVQVMTQIDGSAKPLPTGQTLRSGTQFSVRLNAAQNSYVYVALVSGSRMPTTIVPENGQNPPRLAAGTTQTFPAGGGQFTLMMCPEQRRSWPCLPPNR